MRSAKPSLSMAFGGGCSKGKWPDAFLFLTRQSSHWIAVIAADYSYSEIISHGKTRLLTELSKEVNLESYSIYWL